MIPSLRRRAEREYYLELSQTGLNLCCTCVIVDLPEQRRRVELERIRAWNIGEKFTLRPIAIMTIVSGEISFAVQFSRLSSLNERFANKREKEKRNTRRATFREILRASQKGRRRNSRRTVRGWRDIWCFWDTLHACNQSVPVSNLANSGPRFFVRARSFALSLARQLRRRTRAEFEYRAAIVARCCDQYATLTSPDPFLMQLCLNLPSSRVYSRYCPSDR